MDCILCIVDELYDIAEETISCYLFESFTIALNLYACCSTLLPMRLMSITALHSEAKTFL